MDEEALDAALTFARMVDASVPAEIQVMRKIVVDGSNTGGYQRTAMVGLDGVLETGEGNVAIEDIELEEESAGIHDRTEEKAVYDLNRLGIPLIEVGTDASIKNPEHARQVATEIGMLLRSTNKARRGLGTIRQDVNVSIEKGCRVEIKGFQDVENIDKLIELEVKRQKNLAELGEELSGQVEGDNVTYVFEDTENDIVSTVLENDGRVFAVRIPDMKERMKEKISGERYVAKELVDYARSRGLNGIIHGDEELEKYGVREEFKELRDVFDAEESDVLAIMAGPRENAREAAKAVKERAKMLVEGEIPEETRVAEQDFTTSYSRPLPGAARMYPETDIPPVRITDDSIEEIEENIPDTLEEREERYAKEIGGELASQIVQSELLPLFEKFKEEADAKLAANIFTNIYSQLESDGVKVDNLQEKHFDAVFTALNDESIEKGDIEDVLAYVAENPDEKPNEAVEEVVAGKSDEEEIRDAVEEVLQEKSDMIEEQGMHAQGALMGVVMQKVDAPGDTVSRILQEELKEFVS